MVAAYAIPASGSYGGGMQFQSSAMPFLPSAPTTSCASGPIVRSMMTMPVTTAVHTGTPVTSPHCIAAKPQTTSRVSTGSGMQSGISATSNLKSGLPFTAGLPQGAPHQVFSSPIKQVRPELQLLPGLSSPCAAEKAASSPTFSQASTVFPSSAESSPVAKFAGTPEHGASVPAPPSFQLAIPGQTALVPSETPCAEVAVVSDAMQKARDLKAQADALAASGAPGSAYMQYLAQKAEEAAKSGYSIQHATRTVRKTQVNKTRVVTDVRTGEQRTEKDSTTFIDEWYEDGPAKVTGTGIFLARGRKSMAEYSDGTTEVQDQTSRAKAMFWAGSFEDGPTHMKTYDNVDIDHLVAKAAARSKLAAQ
eukprot:TRINITY_DN31937_c0_g1_i1.p1 TRINITY_DN31937_c0_g1~~TRINITY_DN31937_c0_g1_i1.p1  ORF type:complete len:364 (+),score=71.00 TRINITY_DN31937_c0_g1_i1:49-1140(+)